MNYAQWCSFKALDPADVKGIKTKIIEYLFQYGALTDDELSEKMGRYRYSVAPRRTWLVDAHLVVDTRKTRMGTRGKTQTLWDIDYSNAVFVRPLLKKRVYRLKKGVISYPNALIQIDRLHKKGVIPGMAGLGCCECENEWPCKTKRILDRARTTKEKIDADSVQDR